MLPTHRRLCIPPLDEGKKRKKKADVVGKKCFARTGNRTLITRVTGEYTDLYTIPAYTNPCGFVVRHVASYPYILGGIFKKTMVRVYLPPSSRL